MTQPRNRPATVDAAPASHTSQDDSSLKNRRKHSAKRKPRIGEGRSIQAAATWLHRLGLVPIRVIVDSKKACDKGWPGTTYTSADDAASAFARHNGNIGFTMSDEYVVVDVDQKNGVDGAASLANLCAEAVCELPSTLTFDTPSGGRHYVFRLPRGIKLKNATGVAPGLDLKTRAGYVVTAPSKFGGKSYRQVKAAGDAIAEMPGALAMLLNSKTKKERPGAEPQPEQRCYSEPGRNTGLTSEAGKLLRRIGDVPYEVFEASVHGLNYAYCRPPIEDGNEVNSVAKSVWGYREVPDIAATLSWKPVTAVVYRSAEPEPECSIHTLVPPVIANAVLDFAHRNITPWPMVLAAVMSSLSALLTCAVALRWKAKETWYSRPIGGGALVMRVGGGKTRALSLADGNMARLADKLAAQFTERLAQYEQEKEAFDRTKKALGAAADKEVQSTGKAGERMQQTVALREPEKPKEPRVKLGDVNEEALGEAVAVRAGPWVVIDELGRLIASFARPGRESFRGFCLECHNAVKGDTVDRLTRKLRIPLVAASFFGGLQVSKLRQLTSNTETGLQSDGFLQRLLWSVLCEPAPAEYIDETPNYEALHVLSEVYDRCFDFAAHKHGASAPTQYIPVPHFEFNPGALEISKEWWLELQNERAGKEADPALEGHLRKYDRLFSSAVVVLHVADDRRGLIQEDTALRAAALCQFHEAHARRMYGLLNEADVSDAQQLAEHVKRSFAKGNLADGFTGRDVVRKGWGYRTSTDAEIALTLLAEHGVVQGVETPAGVEGRHTTNWYLNPTLKETAK